MAEMCNLGVCARNVNYGGLSTQGSQTQGLLEGGEITNFRPKEAEKENHLGIPPR